MTEAEFQRWVIEAATLYGWHVFHPKPARLPNGKIVTAQDGHTGFPDLVLARRGVVMFWELKSETGRLGREQVKWRDEIGWAWTCWRPADKDAILTALQQVSA